MKAYLIDPFATTVTEVEHNGDYKQIYDYIKADLFTTIQLDSAGDTLYIDDEGLFVDEQAYFWLRGYPILLCGRALVLGCNLDTGDSRSPRLSLNDTKSFVKWQNPLTAQMYLPQVKVKN